MPRKILDGDSDSDSEVKFQTDNQYAKNYDNWRKIEELNKLKTKYGDESLQILKDEDSSSSSDEDEEGEQLTEEIEKQFFKTLSYLKNKDPKIYNENVRFFDVDENIHRNQKKKKKEKPMYISDYERELILKKNGELSDCEQEENDERAHSPTYNEEQKKIKEILKNALDKIVEVDEEEEWGGMLKVRQKTEEEKMREEAEYKEWLAGQKREIEDKETETELKPLKEYWNNPNLDDGEKFLRDYILNKKYLSNKDEEYIPTYEEIIHDSDKNLSEDEENIDRQEEFEYKYNFRFEEPDQEFIKRYPRTMEQSLRKSDDRRKLKRAETKERKQKEKEQKMQDLRKLQQLKLKEIEEKIEKLKKVTGNDNIGFKDEDLESDFDPEAHDRRMQSLFNDEFYQGGADEDEQKPEFPELDEYLELENWEKWKGEKDEEYAPHCEDEGFNMDCDYDPEAAAVEKEVVAVENMKGKKKQRKRKTLFAKAVSQPKPVFDPNDKTYEEYLDEYYKLDCEDIIGGDLPCRFKYRKVVPNNFGLTIEEILKANDRELNRWCSLKKAMQYRPDDVEKYDQIAYSKKGENLALKRKILPSLFKDEKLDEEIKKQTKEANEESKESFVANKTCKKQKKKKRKNKHNIGQSEVVEEINTVTTTTKSKEKKKRRNIKKSNSADNRGTSEKTTKEGNCSVVEKKKTVISQNTEKMEKKRKKLCSNTTTKTTTDDDDDTISPKKVMKSSDGIGISDARLSAYGLNPKKYKNKLKYKKQK